MNKGKVEPGIWEVVITPSWAGHMAGTNYDIELEAISFGQKTSHSIAKGGKVIDIYTSGDKIAAQLIDSKVAIREKIKVKPFYASFHPISLQWGLRKII